MTQPKLEPLLVQDAMSPPPRLQLSQVTLWCEYPIWGLLLYDDQSPWLSILETIHVCYSRARHGKAVFAGLDATPDGNRVHEWLQYDVPLSPILRHLLFSDQHIDEIAASGADNGSMWSAWMKELGDQRLIDPARLRQAFPHFPDLASAVALLRSSQIDGNNNRRPTSRHLLPLGDRMILADVNEVRLQPDRRWLRRTGELMYLMLNRSTRSAEIERLLTERLLKGNSPWNRLTRKLQGREATEDEPRSLTTGYLPLVRHDAYERLARDWSAILSLRRMPVATSLASLARLSGFDLMLYVVERSVETVEGADGHVPPFVMDMVGAGSGGLRKLSDALYKRHRRLPQEAMRAFVERYRESEEWQSIEQGEQTSVTARNHLAQRFLWDRDIGSDPYGMPSAKEQIEDLLNEVQRPRSHSVGAMYVAHGRQTGAVTARAGVGTWYAPNDELVEALVLANVSGPVELEAFLATLHARYHIVIGAQEAMLAFGGELPETEASFRDNERSFEERLRLLGYLERKSDDCAFVINPFHSETVLDQKAS
jgi:hypothetical protein